MVRYPYQRDHTSFKRGTWFAALNYQSTQRLDQGAGLNMNKLVTENKHESFDKFTKCDQFQIQISVV